MGFFLIGLYEALFLEIENSYGIFMFSIALLFFYHYRKNSEKTPEKTKSEITKKSKSR
tara:strand:- start:1517 stop:1690 length:174 start_codon:yes stop_codon:yes gene_type:complete